MHAAITPPDSSVNISYYMTRSGSHNLTGVMTNRGQSMAEPGTDESYLSILATNPPFQRSATIIRFFLLASDNLWSQSWSGKSNTLQSECISPSPKPV